MRSRLSTVIAPACFVPFVNKILDTYRTTDDYTFMEPHKCRIKECRSIADTYKGGARGLCCKHYRRFLRHGSATKYNWQKHPIYTLDGFLISKGYAYCQVNGKRVKRCRIIMSKAIGQPLSSTEIVHHRDRNRLNDSPGNLQLTSRAEHIKIHGLPGANKIA